MLHFIRERAQGWIAWVIIGLLIIPFALWGINEYFGGGGSVSIASVNGTDISQRQFQQAFYQQRSRMQQMFGEQYDARLFDEQIRQGVINELIERELLRQYLDANGYRISESLVANTIRSLEGFQENGVFSSTLYEQQVRSQGQSPVAFEQSLGQGMLISQLPEGLMSTSLITEAELDAVIRLQQQQRDVDYLALPVAAYRDQSVADEAAIQAYYDNNLPRFMAPEQLRVEYVELDASRLQPEASPDEASLREFFEGRANEYRVPEERKARHILIQLAENADEAAIAAARARAETLLTGIRGGASFEELAKTHSDDPGSAPAGGELGFFSRGMMDPAFEEAAFGLQSGQVSELVRTSFGFHILKLEEIRAARGKSFEDVRPQLLREYQQEQALEKYFDLAEQLTNLAYETPDSLRDVAEQLGLELKQSPFITRQGVAAADVATQPDNQLFANPQLLNVAFSDDVLRQGYNSEAVEVAENHVLVMRLAEHREASQQPLETVREQARALLISESARDAVVRAGEAALQRLQAGESYQDVADSLALKSKALLALGRNATDVDAALVSEAFRLSRPLAGDATFGSVVLASGDFLLLRLTAVRDGDPAAVSAADREALKRRLLSTAGANAQRYLIDTLKAEADIVLNSEDL